MFFILHFLVFFSFFALSLAENANVTVDSNSPLIAYNGQWLNATLFEDTFSGDFGQFSEDKAASASFTFTGVAVSFLAPKWPSKVGVELAIDLDQADVVDLRDYNQHLSTSRGNPTVNSSIVWSKEGLQDTQHTVQITFPEGDFDMMAIDAFVVTPHADSHPSFSPPDNIGTIVGIVGGVMAAVGIGSSVWLVRTFNADQERRLQEEASEPVHWILLPRMDEDVEKGSFEDITDVLTPLPKAYFPVKE